ncbi:MAG: hypothetical protein ACXWVG_03830 [Telluria sp.]
MRIYRHLTVNDIQLEEFPFKRELSMEAYLIDNEGVLALDDDDVFNTVQFIDAEVFLAEGQQHRGRDGRIDMVATYSSEYIAIIELKLEEINFDSLRQIEGYLIQRNQVLDRHPNIIGKNLSPNPKWIGVLVGSTIDSALANVLRNGYETIEKIPIAALTLKRFRGSDGSVLIITDTYFRSLGGQDRTKYLFEGKTFGKGRLVQAVVKRYVETHPGITFAQLVQEFPQIIQGTTGPDGGVVKTADQANEIYTRTGYRRHFMKPEDLIELANETAAVSNQWGIGNIQGFLDKAQELNFKIEAVPQ